MTKLQKKFLALLLFFGSSTFLYSQTGSWQFTYDAAGNQIKRTYCTGNCAPDKKAAEEIEEDQPLAEQWDDKLIMYPNPTSGMLYIDLGEIQAQGLQSIRVYNYIGSLIYEIPPHQKSKAGIDLSRQASGVYIARFHFSDNSTFSQKIIKK